MWNETSEETVERKILKRYQDTLDQEVSGKLYLIVKLLNSKSSFNLGIGLMCGKTPEKTQGYKSLFSVKLSNCFIFVHLKVPKRPGQLGLERCINKIFGLQDSHHHFLAQI